MNRYEQLNEEMIAAQRRLEKAVAARDLDAVEHEDKEVQRLLAEMKAERKRM